MRLVAWLTRPIRRSLAAKLVLAVVLVHGVLITLLLWENVAREHAALQSGRRDRAAGVARMLATSGANGMLSRDVAGLSELIAASATMKSLRYSMFVDPSGRVLAHSNPALVGKYLSADHGPALRAGGTAARVIKETSTTIDVVVPVLAGNEPIGWSWVSVSLDDIHANLRRVLVSAVGYGIAAILLGLLISLVTAHSVTRRLQDLAEVSNRFRLGERNVRVRKVGSDEVAAAAEGINAMLEAVGETERSLKAAQQIARLGSWQYDPDRPKLIWSEEMGEIFGVAEAPTFEEFLQILPENQKLTMLHLSGADDGERVSSAKIIVNRPDGTQRICWTEARSQPRGGGGRLLSGICQDVTERETAAAQLRQAQKMEAVGQLTGGLAHDFNNILAIAIGNLDLLAEELPEDSPARAYAEEALAAALRGSEHTRQLLAFSRRQPLTPRTIDLNRLITGISTLWRRSLGDSIDVRMTLADDPWLASADPSQVESAVLNLVINARDAMPHGGSLTVETRNVTVNAEDLDGSVEEDIEPGDYALIIVSDTGTGMPPDVAERAFEPFFTTKAVDKGSGLGLSMVYGFAKQSGGHVKLYSEPGHGTTVRLYLPRAASTAERMDAGGDEAAAPSGSEQILVVEDDESVRRVAARQLADLGYSVHCASNGPDALDLLDRHRFDLLFTDVVMPGGMNGIELARRAVAKVPGLKVLYTSGFAQPMTHGLPGAEPLLSKPYRKRDLAARLREVLDPPGLKAAG